MNTHKSKEELLDMGFKWLFEDESYEYLAKKIPDCHGEFSYHIINKKNGKALHQYPQASSIYQAEMLSTMTRKMYDKDNLK